MSWYPIDLHCHSWYSDGNASPAELAARAAEAGMKVVALTDHGTVGGFQEFSRACRRHGIETLPGAEVLCQYQGIYFDVLAYGFDPESQAVGEVLACQQRAEGALLAWHLERFCPGLTVADVVAHYGIPCPVLPPYWLRKYRLEVNGTTTVELDEEAHVTSGERAGRQRALYLEHLPTFQQVVGAVRSSGGIVAFAHPHQTAIRLYPERPKSYQKIDKCLQLIDEIAPFGLDAVELRHNSHHDGIVRMITQHRFSSPQLFTGGSDYHGDRPGENKPHVHFGTSGLTFPEFRALRHTVQQRRMGNLR